MLIKKALREVRRSLDVMASKNRSKKASKLINTKKSGDYFVKPTPPYCAQFASPSLISNILNKKIKAQDDPKWKSFGFSSVGDYEFWSWRLCGLICVKMILDANQKAQNETIATLTGKAVEMGGYNIQDDGGWFPRSLVRLAQQFGLSGKVFRLISVNEITEFILEDEFFIASVHPGVIRYDVDKVPDSEKSGHLVLVWGVKIKNGKIAGFYIHNPSGRKPLTQKGAFISLERFCNAFGERGFSIY